jgi:hypothetical protein
MSTGDRQCDAPARWSTFIGRVVDKATLTGNQVVN